MELNNLNPQKIGGILKSNLEKIKKSISSLDPLSEGLVILNFKGKDQKEIAGAVNRSYNKVKAMILNARSRFMHRLFKEGVSKDTRDAILYFLERRDYMSDFEKDKNLKSIINDIVSIKNIDLNNIYERLEEARIQKRYSRSQQDIELLTELLVKHIKMHYERIAATYSIIKEFNGKWVSVNDINFVMNRIFDLDKTRFRYYGNVNNFQTAALLFQHDGVSMKAVQSIYCIYSLKYNALGKKELIAFNKGNKENENSDVKQTELMSWLLEKKEYEKICLDPDRTAVWIAKNFPRHVEQYVKLYLKKRYGWKDE
ncbi:MAG: hypothetical protein N3G74_00405 [Candidatus Micrarchaeota archaeon]|nr:hypothetical protein [Candidatus Micrarchaeota archaeon]